MFSAYTIKKILPRLIIAAIVIQLSWWLCTEAIKLNNVLAAGIEGLMYAPFGGIDGKLNLNSLLVSGGTSSVIGAQATGALFAGYIAAAVAAGPGTVIGVLALAGTALLGLLIALFLLVVRRIVILFLVLTVPIALAAWILPGTQKLWKLWWESFVKLLLVYPMILGLIAAGRIAAYVTSKSTNSFLGFFIIMICLFGPLFLIPALLKLSGTAFATITGAVNNRGKGAFDRLRNVRSNEAKKTREKFMAGERFNEHSKNPFAKGVNTLGRRASVGLGGRFGYGERGRSLMETKEAIAAAELEKRNPNFAINKEDEKVMSLLAMNANRAKAQEWIQSRAATLRSEGKHDEANAFEKNYGDALATASAIGFTNNTRRAALMSGGAISYGFSAGEKGWKEATQAMREIAGVDPNDEHPEDNQTYRNLTNQFQYLAKGMGRPDLSAATDGGEYNGYRAWSSVGLYQHGNGKPSDIKGSADYFNALLERTQDPGKLKDIDVKNFANLSDAESVKYNAYRAGDTSALSAEELGDIRSRTITGAQKAATIFTKEMATIGSQASGSVRDEALKQQARILGNNKNAAVFERYKDDTQVIQAVRGYDPQDAINRRVQAGEI